MVQLRGIDQQQVREQQLRSSDCLNESIWAGCKASITSMFVSGGCVAALSKYSDFFRTHFTVGAKASFVMLPTFYVFWYTSEKAIARCSMDNNRNKFKTAGLLRHRQQQQQEADEEEELRRQQQQQRQQRHQQ